MATDNKATWQDELALIEAVLNGYPDSMAKADALRAVRVLQSIPVQVPPVAWVTVENGTCVSTRSADFRHIADGQYHLYAGPLDFEMLAAVTTLEALGYVYKEGEQWTAPTPQPSVTAPSPTVLMSMVQRILHVGGRNNAAGYVEFGSVQAVEALVRHVLRDIPPKQQQWVGLTAAQKCELVEMTDSDPQPHHLRELIDVTEDKLKEKNTAQSAPDTGSWYASKEIDAASSQEPIGEVRNGEAYFYNGMYTNKTDVPDGTKLYTTPPAAQPAPSHPDDLAVDRFAAEMKSKLAKAREKGRSGWETCPPDDLSRMLREHIEKGDPRDVANFAMMLWSLGAGIAATPPAEQPAQVQEPDYKAMWHKVWPDVGSFVRASSDDLEKFAKAVSTSPASEPAPVETTLLLKDCWFLNRFDFSQTPPYFRYDTDDRTAKENESELWEIQAQLREHGFELVDYQVEHDCITGHLSKVAQPAPVAWPEHEFIQWGAKKYGPLVKAVINLLAEIDSNHDSKGYPQKYGVPYGAVNTLRGALTATPQSSQSVQELQRYSPDGEGGMEVDSLGAYVKHQDVLAFERKKPDDTEGGEA